jgi:RNA exonuclease 4
MCAPHPIKIEPCKPPHLTKKEQTTKKQPPSPKGKGKKNKQNKSKKNSPKKQQEKKVEQELTLEEQGRYVALDCEFVGVGPGGYNHALARVSLVDYNNAVLLDTYVRVDEPVTDYRTWVSGITEEHVQSDIAIDAEKCVALVKKLLHGKILVGHGLKNDLGVLGFDHPWSDTRDTAKYEPFMKKAKKHSPCTMPRPRKLKDLALTKLERVIQKEGESHCSIEDAIAALDLYKKARTKWEDAMEYKIEKTRKIENKEVVELVEE